MYGATLKMLLMLRYSSLFWKKIEMYGGEEKNIAVWSDAMHNMSSKEIYEKKEENLEVSKRTPLA